MSRIRSKTAIQSEGRDVCGPEGDDGIRSGRKGIQMCVKVMIQGQKQGSHTSIDGILAPLGRLELQLGKS